MTAPELHETGRLPARVLAGWDVAACAPGERVVVAVSGGVDSLVLLHLLRFPLRPSLRLRLVVAHYDHAMREESRCDARWLCGLAAAWGLPFREARASGAPPATEAEARTLRYRFLWEVVEEEGAARLFTAHHADDQVETIVFRAVRGAGVRGLAGMPRSRAPGLARPLLAEPRRALETYAARVRLRPRLDPTNVETTRARNRIRHEILPALERVHPGARRGLLRLGRNARRAAEALDALLAPLVGDVVRGRSKAGIAFSREDFLAHAPAVRNALLRKLAEEAGIRLDESGTEDALEFISTGISGGRLHLPGAATLARDFDLLRLERGGETARRSAEAGEADTPFVLSGPWPGGTGMARLAGRPVRVEWGGDHAEASAHPGCTETFEPALLAFPLTVRRWAAGDRVRTNAGSRKLKKLFGERRVPRRDRERLAVVQDGRGEVIWVPGLHRAPAAPPSGDPPTWYLGIWDEHGDG